MPTTSPPGPATRRSRTDMAALVAVALSVGVPSDVADAAADAITSRRSTRLAVSGWLASGKDTLAPLAMQAAGARNIAHHYWANALKDEVDVVIAIVTASDTETSAAANVATEMDVPFADALHVASILFPETREQGHQLTARTRTPQIRAVLQHWGTNVRRAQDEDYWVKKALRPVVTAIAEDGSPFFTDTRFPNEVTYPQRLGFTVVRIDITPETQLRRHLARDGHAPDPAAIGHVSEHALDTFPGFDLRLDNNEDTPDLGVGSPIVQAIAGALTATSTQDHAA